MYRIARGHSWFGRTELTGAVRRIAQLGLCLVACIAVEEQQHILLGLAAFDNLVVDFVLSNEHLDTGSGPEPTVQVVVDSYHLNGKLGSRLYWPPHVVGLHLVAGIAGTCLVVDLALG